MGAIATIRRISYMDILGDKAAKALIDASSAECAIPDGDLQPHMYAAMESAGAIQCFGAYVGDDLVGFAAVLHGIMPHHGKRVATLESLYTAPAHRDSGAGNALLEAAEAYASETGSVVLLYTARSGSAIETVLSRRSGCKRSHAVFTRWL